MKAYILAGGRGTRLAAVTNDEIPKPMAKLCGKPVLQHAVENLVANGITEIYISVGYLHEVIEQYFGNGEAFGADIKYIVEDKPLGSGGALYYLKGKTDDDFIVCSGDTVFDVCIEKMYKFHKEKGGLITLFAHPNLHPYDSDLVIADRDGLVLKFDLKNSVRNYYYKNNVNAGFFIISPEALRFFEKPEKINLEHDFVNYYIQQRKVYCYNSTEYIKDAGTPERFFAVEQDIKNGVVSAKNLKNRQKAVFLDRDGTINKYKGFIKTPEEIELADGASEAVKLINESGYLAIVISNQPVIARGEATFGQVESSFDKIQTLLGLDGAYLDGIYYCPHHPHSGYEGEVKELKIKCRCRKPDTGLIEKAVERFNLDLSKCFMIGDSNVDVQTALNAGIKCVKVKSDLDETETVKPHFRAENLTDAVKIILQEEL